MLLAVRFLNEEQQIELLTLKLNGMKNNELRIGNFVHHNDENIKTNFINDFLTVCEIDENNINIYYINIDSNKQIVRGKVGYKPILLTEEWHNKFGVFKNGFGSFEYRLSERQLICFSGDYVYLMDISAINGKRGADDNLCTLWNKDIKKRDMYVHEWQNLYFTLSGHELYYTQAGRV